MSFISWARSVTKKFFVIGNLALALLFILSCYGGRVDPGRMWAVGLPVIASFYLFLLLIFYILFWLLAKPVFMFISVAAIAFCWAPLKNLFRLQTAPNFVMLKAPSQLRVMDWNVESFNLAGRKKNPGSKEKMFEIIRKYGPDVACFQEAALGDTNTRAINYLPAVLAAIQMPYYHYSFNPKLNYDRDHHFGIITVSRYPIISKHTLSYEPYDYNSIFQYVDIVKDGDTVRVINVHLQSLKLNEADRGYVDRFSEQKENMQQTKNVLGKLKGAMLRRKFQADRIHRAVMESPYTTVVCGDFNDVPNSYAYNTVRGDMRDAFTEKGTGIGRTFSAISPTLRIDNIFCDPHFTVEQFVRIKQKLSDHFPLVADLFLEKVD